MKRRPQLCPQSSPHSNTQSSTLSYLPVGSLCVNGAPTRTG